MASYATGTGSKGAIKHEIWASQALGLLEDETIITGLVARDAGADFTGAEGDTVSIKRPSKLQADEMALSESRNHGTGEGQSGNINLQKLNEHKITVSLKREVYNAVALTAAELDLDVTNYGAQVLAPQTAAVALSVERTLTDILNGKAPKYTPLGLDAAKDAPATIVDKYVDAKGATEIDGKHVRKLMVQLRAKLNSESVPMQGRILAIGTAIESALLGDDHLTKVNESGGSATLRAATIGDLYGFRIVVVQGLDEMRMVAFHPTAYTLITRAPIVPAGGPVGSSSAHGGVSLTVQKDYDPSKRVERSIVNTYLGVGATRDIPLKKFSDGTVATEAAKGLDEVSALATMVRAVAVVAKLNPAKDEAKGS